MATVRKVFWMGFLYSMAIAVSSIAGYPLSIEWV